MELRRNKAAIAAIVVGLVLAGLVALLATSDTERTGSVNFEIVGEVGPQIAGTTIDGEEFALWDERGNWVVVNFFASWCVGCIVEHPELVEFTRRHQDDGVKLVSVMFADSEENGREFFEKYGGTWPTLIADTGPIIIDYGVTAVPETLLVSRTGRVVQKWLGTNGVTADQLDATIAEFERIATGAAAESTEAGG